MTYWLRFTALAAALTAMLLLALPAGAAELDDLRKAGTVAERFDGFVEARGAPDAETRRVIEAVNAQRRELYDKRAAEQKVPASEVAKIYAAQIVAKLPPGAWIKRPDGSYAQK